MRATEELEDLLAEVGEVELACAMLGDDHDVDGRRQRGAVAAEDLAQSALHSVPDDGIPDTPTDGEAQAGEPTLRGEDHRVENTGPRAPASREDLLELTPSTNTGNLWESLAARRARCHGFHWRVRGGQRVDDVRILVTR